MEGEKSVVKISRRGLRGVLEFYFVLLTIIPPRACSWEYSYLLTHLLSLLSLDMAACKAGTEDSSPYFTKNELPTGMDKSVGLMAKCLIFFAV